MNHSLLLLPSKICWSSLEVFAVKENEKFLPLHLLYCVSELYKEEWWQQLKLHNKQSYKERCLKNVTPWYILTPQVTELIFLISEMLHQPPEVRYLTIEIFDR
jgi:hypothetical protein